MWDGPEPDDAGLQRLRTHLETAQRIAHLGSWEVELPSGTVRWGGGLDAILGWPAGEDGGYERLLAVVHPDDRARVARVHAAAVSDGTAYSIEHRVVRPDGVRHLHQEVVVEEKAGVPIRLIGTVQDVTERMQVTRRLVDTESRRRELLHRLVQAGAEARSRLAGDLHDGPVQILTATAMRLEVLSRTDPDPPPWLAEASASVRDVCSQLREVLFELHPHLTDGGVGDAVTHLATTVMPATPVRVTVHGDEPSPAAARAVHGVVQEAFWDLSEHGTAREISVEVVAVDDVAIVVDGGPGEQPLLTRAGLLGVRERCEAVGGTVQLDGDGRILRCTLPAVDEPEVDEPEVGEPEVDEPAGTPT